MINIPIIRHERMSDIFQKFHLEGLPVEAVIHYFEKAEPEDAPYHDHPFDFVSFIISGGYIEETPKYYDPMKDPDGKWHIEGKWYHINVNRRPGTSHQVRATDIHKITFVPEGGCYTLILPGPVIRKSGFWRFDDGVAAFREWDQEEFKPVER